MTPQLYLTLFGPDRICTDMYLRRRGQFGDYYQIHVRAERKLERYCLEDYTGRLGRDQRTSSKLAAVKSASI
jgi:hypothetical protein